MSNTVEMGVKTRISVETDGSVKAGFDRVGDGARATALEIQRVKKQLGELRAPAELKSLQAELADLQAGAAKGGRGLGGLANELRKTDRGFKQLQGGVFGLLSSASLLDERFGKGLAIVGVAHSATMSVRGLSGALPMIGKAASMLGSPLGIAALGFTAAGAGAAYFLAKLKEATRGTEEQRAALGRLQAQGMQIRAEKMLPGSMGLTIQRYDRMEREHAAAAPFHAEGRRLYEDLARLEDRRQAMMRHPGEPFPERPLQLMRKSSGDLQQLLGGPQARFGAGEQTQAIRDEQERLRKMVESPLSRQPLAERQMQEAQAAFDRTNRDTLPLKSEQDKLQRKVQGFQEIDRIAQAAEDRKREIPETLKMLKADIGEHQAASPLLPLGPLANFGGGPLAEIPKEVREAAAAGNRNAQAALALREQGERLVEEQKRLQAGAPRRQINRAMQQAGIGPQEDSVAVNQRLKEVNAQLEELGKRRKENADALLEAQTSLNKLSLEELKNRQAITEEGVNSTRARLHEEQNRVAGMQGNLGLMQSGQLEAMMAVGKALKSGGQVSAEMEQFAQGNQLIAGSDIWRDYQRRRFAGNKQAQGAAEFFGLDDHAKELQQGLGVMEGLNKKLTDQVGVKAQADEKLIVDGLSNVLAPALRGMFQDIQKRFVEAPVKMAREEAKKAFEEGIQKVQNQQGAGQRAAAQ